MKKTFAKLVYTIGGQPHYSGKTRTMYVHGIPEDNRWLLDDNCKELTFKVVFQ